MTKTEILAMKPGRELDALIAEQVFDWGKDKIYHELKMVRQDLSYLPCYSALVQSAWPIAVKFKISVINSEDGWYAVVTDDIIHSINLVKPDISQKVCGKHWALADNVPEAICKAALCVVMVKEEG